MSQSSQEKRAKHNDSGTGPGEPPQLQPAEAEQPQSPQSPISSEPQQLLQPPEPPSKFVRNDVGTYSSDRLRRPVYAKTPGSPYTCNTF